MHSHHALRNSNLQDRRCPGDRLPTPEASLNDATTISFTFASSTTKARVILSFSSAVGIIRRRWWCYFDSPVVIMRRFTRNGLVTPAPAFAVISPRHLISLQPRPSPARRSSIRELHGPTAGRGLSPPRSSLCSSTQMYIPSLILPQPFLIFRARDC